jgi:Domain of unknown function (DUF6818)
MVHWNGHDLDTLLRIIDEIRPVSSNDWDGVSKAFNEWSVTVRNTTRTRRAIVQKFNSLANNPPTGTGEYSDRQKQARELQVAIDRSREVLLVQDHDTASDTAEEEATEANATETNAM